MSKKFWIRNIYKKNWLTLYHHYYVCIAYPVSLCAQPTNVHQTVKRKKKLRNHVGAFFHPCLPIFFILVLTMNYIVQCSVNLFFLLCWYLEQKKILGTKKSILRIQFQFPRILLTNWFNNKNINYKKIRFKTIENIEYTHGVNEKCMHCLLRWLSPFMSCFRFGINIFFSICLLFIYRNVYAYILYKELYIFQIVWFNAGILKCNWNRELKKNLENLKP